MLATENEQWLVRLFYFQPEKNPQIHKKTNIVLSDFRTTERQTDEMLLSDRAIILK